MQYLILPEIFGRQAAEFHGKMRSQSVVARAVKSILRVNGENALASDGTLEERYEYTPYGERTRKAGGELPLTPALSRSTQRLSTGRQGKGWARRAVPREKNGPPHPEPPIV